MLFNFSSTYFDLSGHDVSSNIGCYADRIQYVHQGEVSPETANATTEVDINWFLFAQTLEGIANISPAIDERNLLQWMTIETRGIPKPVLTQFYLNMGKIENWGLVHMDPKGAAAFNLLIAGSKLWMFLPEETCKVLSYNGKL